jgi:hypothetical protein
MVSAPPLWLNPRSAPAVGLCMLNPLEYIIFTRFFAEKLKQIRQKRLIFGDDVEISYNPPADGNCQFQCIAKELSESQPNPVTHLEVRQYVVTLLDENQPMNFVPATEWPQY